jgi:hypothetical protein
MDIRTLKKGDRILFKRHGQNDVQEGYVQEFTKDMKYVNLNFMSWLPTAEVTVIEILPKRESPELPKAVSDEQPTPKKGKGGDLDPAKPDPAEKNGEKTDE